jgi:hypothetical protein
MGRKSVFCGVTHVIRWKNTEILEELPPSKGLNILTRDSHCRRVFGLMVAFIGLFNTSLD